MPLDHRELRQVIEKAPVSRDVVHRFVGGASTDEVLRVAGELVDRQRSAPCALPQ